MIDNIGDVVINTEYMGDNNHAGYDYYCICNNRKEFWNVNYINDEYGYINVWNINEYGCITIFCFSLSEFLANFMRYNNKG